MYYRVFIVLVIAFWLTMNALLIRSELRPADQSLRQIPVAHVIKQIFRHQQPSNLMLNADGASLGSVRLAPSIDPASNQRLVDSIGNLRLGLGNGPKTRFTWSGQIALSPTLEFERLKLHLVAHQAIPLHIELSVDAQEKVVHLLSKNADNQIISQQDYPLDRGGATLLLNQLGLEPALLDSLGSQQARQGNLTAQLASLNIRGEPVETYALTYTQNEQTLFEVQISQIGQILQVKTLLGYTLAPEDLAP